MDRVCRESCRQYLPTLPREPGAQTPSPTHPVSWVRTGPSGVLSSQKSRNCSSEMQTPMPASAPLPGDSRGVRWKVGQGSTSHSHSKHFLTFLISPWQQGPPILPAGSWALPAASVQLAILPVCVLESACDGVTTGGSPGCQGEQEKSGRPTGQSQPISFHCL